MPTALPETNVKVAHSHWRSYRGRAALIVALVPLLAASHALYKVMPPADLKAQFDGRHPSVYWKNDSHLDTSIWANPFEADVEPIQLMSIDTGKITSATRADLYWPYGLNTRGEKVAIGRPQSITQSVKKIAGGPDQPHDRCAYFENLLTNETRCIEFDWPRGPSEKSVSTLVNNRYVVTRDQTSIYAVDLDDAQPQSFSIANPYVGIGPNFSVNAIYGTEFLYEIYAPAQPNSVLHKLELFKLGNHQIQLVKTIEMGCSGITRLDDQLLTLSTDCKQVEFRSLVDLQFVKAVDIVPQFLATHDIVDLQGNLLIGRNRQTYEHEYYDILSGELLELPFSGMMQRWWSGREKYWCFDGGPGRRDFVYVYDSQARRVCLELPYACKTIAFLEDGRFAVAHPAYGVCTVVYDLKTGGSIRQAPYQWCAWALATLLLAWFAWWIAWLVLSARASSWAGLDFTLIFAIVPTNLIYLGVGEMLPRIGFWSSSVNFSTLYGALTGLLVATAVFSTFSFVRCSAAFVPLSIVYAALNYWLSSIAARPRSIDEVYYLRVSLISIGIVALLIATCVLMRRIGLRLSKTIAATPSPHAMNKQLSVLDLMIFMACAGIILAAARPLVMPMPRISVPFLLDRYWLPTTLAASTISCVVIMVVLNQRAWLAKCGFAFATFAWCCLILQQVLIFAGSSIRLFAIEPSALQTIAVTSTSTFICGLALRLRSYRIERIGI